MIKIALGILASFRWVFPPLGVDYKKLRSILWVKLTTDTRRTYHNIHVKSKKGKPQDAFKKLLWLHMLSGLFLGFFVHEVKSLFLALLFVCTFSLAMAVMSLTSHFAVVLLDTTDNTILLPRPVDSRTLFLSRILHIIFYLFSLNVALCAAPWAVGTYMYGEMFFLGFLLMLVLSTLLGVSLIYMFYLAVMNISPGERFRDTITFIQIALPLTLLILYFLKGVNDVELEKLTVSIGAWAYFVPPAWFAGLVDGMVSGSFPGPYVWFAMLSVVAPLLCFLAAVWFLAPVFNRKLARMEIDSQREKPAPPRSGLMRFLARLLNRDKKERAAFSLVWRLASRDSKFKLNTYSVLGLFFGIFFFIIIIPDKDIWVALHRMPETKKYIPLLYMSCVLLVNAITQAPFSDYHKAAWIYHALPFSRPGEILSGALKTLTVKFSFPVLLAAGFSLFLWGPGVIDDILLAFMNIQLFCLLLAFIFLRRLPFSGKHEITGMAGKIIRTLASLVLFIGLAYLHYRITDYPAAVIAFVALQFEVLYFLFRRYKRTPWENIEETAAP